MRRAVVPKTIVPGADNDTA